ncbi:hypothetical protein BJL95_07530 [Methylomonas sp. LWB]|nr:hypothetical protein BJL95_07530 [Methylomonas sp. LWB]
MQVKEASGEIDLFYMDESGFSTDGCIPCAGHPQGKTLVLSANTPGCVNVIGLMSRQGAGYFHPVKTTVTSDQLLQKRWRLLFCLSPADKLTVLIMDNAPVHLKAEREELATWLLGRVWVWFLPSYSSEFNPIEILWRKVIFE